MDEGVGEFHGTERFEIRRRLGSGGMGVVYEAFDRERGQRVALKTVLRLRNEDHARLRAEFRVLQGLRHPNLVTFEELFDGPDRCFFTMELVEGESFVQWVRPGASTPPGADATPPGRLDVPRLRAALAQLGRGLQALHEAGRVHRDIKPSNVLVTAGGRVVLLDFGLAAAVARPGEAAATVGVGTVEYMAPEQAAAAHVGEEADWYAVGVVLYEALTGRLPFTGAPLEVLAQKQQQDPPPPRSLDPSLPADLDALCVELLRFDPAARPRGRRLLARLGVTPDRDEVLDDPGSTSSHAQVFVGRRRELGQLRRAYADLCRGVGGAVLVHGESGVGKTALCRRFCADLTVAEEPVVVLRSRCHERRPLPFRAFEGIVDDLSRYLAAQPAAEVAPLLPANAGLLGEVFPPLRRVKAVAAAVRPAMGRAAAQLAAAGPETPEGHAGAPGGGASDPQELRTRLFAAVRELLGRVAARQPLVLVFDDLHWADPDSLALVAELLRPPEAPPLLLLATLRSGTEFVGAWGAPEVGPYLPGAVSRLRLEPLGDDQARELATALVGRFRARAAVAEEVAAEGRGLPLFIEELVRLAATQHSGAGSLRLEEVIRARAARLPTPARRVLELLAVAGAPLPLEALARAAALDAIDLQRWLGRLRVAGFAIVSGSRGTDLAAPAHERVREAVLACLERDARLAGERDLALALEAGGRSRPELLAVHWRGAGERARAAEYAEAAAEHAVHLLAFDHAAFHYRMALDLGVAPPPRPLLVKLADALAYAGRGLEAAESYLDAVAGAPPFEALDLRRRAAAHYLRSGAIGPGLEVVRELCASLGTPLATSPRRALTSLLAGRALVRLRGLGYLRRDPRELATEELVRLDAAFAVAGMVSPVDTISGTNLQTRGLLRSLRVGEPSHVAEGLATEAGFVSLAGRRARARAAKLLERAEAAAGTRATPRLRAILQANRGMVAFYLGSFPAAAEHFREAETLLRDHCTGLTWELGTVLLFSQFAMTHLGRIAEVARRVPLLVAEAIDRGDLYTATNLRLSILNSAWLARDDVGEARRVALEASGRWGREQFNTQHWYDLVAQGQIGLYAGDGAAAHALVLEQWEGLRQSLLLRIQLVRVEALGLRARCALAAAGGGRRGELLAAAARDARRILRERTAWGDALAELLLAGVAASRGDEDAARARLEAARADFEAVGMTLHAAVARRRLGALLGGDAGAALVAAADQWLRDQRVVAPERWAALLAPGFDGAGGGGG